MIGYLRLSYGKELQYKLDSLFTIGEKTFFFPFRIISVLRIHEILYRNMCASPTSLFVFRLIVVCSIIRTKSCT